MVPTGTALEKALEMAELIAQHPGFAIRAHKKLINKGLEGTYTEGKNREFDTAMAFYSSPAFAKAAKGMAQVKSKL